MPLLTDFNNAQNTDFQYRVQMALISTAIQAESVAAASHQSRSAYAVRVLADPAGFARLMAPGFTVDGAVDPATATDTDIKNRASAIWNAYCVMS